MCLTCSVHMLGPHSLPHVFFRRSYTTIGTIQGHRDLGDHSKYYASAFWCTRIVLAPAPRLLATENYFKKSQELER